MDKDKAIDEAIRAETRVFCPRLPERVSSALGVDAGMPWRPDAPPNAVLPGETEPL